MPSQILPVETEAAMFILTLVGIVMGGKGLKPEYTG